MGGDFDKEIEEWEGRRNKAGGPAFPVPPESGVASGTDGMTLLDYFAAKAMHAEITSAITTEVAFALNRAAEKQGISIETQIARNAYDMAEAMIAERNRRNGN